jgi:hypothetical protein
MFTNLLSNYTNLENIAHENQLKDILDLKEAILCKKINLQNGQEIYKEINKLDDLSLDGQNDMYKGIKIFKELKSSSTYNNLSFEQKSKVLIALSDTKDLWTKVDVRLEGTEISP